MADNETVVHGVRWDRVLSVGQIFRSFRIALWPPSKLMLCLAALVVTVGVGLLLDTVFRTDVCGKSFGENMKDVYRAAMGYQVDVRSFRMAGVDVGNPEVVAVHPEKTADLNWDNVSSARGFYYGPLEALRHMGRLVRGYWQDHFWFALLNTIVAVLAWSFFGGAVCRIAALQFALDERPTIGEALRFACKRYASLAASPLVLFVVILLMAVPVTLVAGGILAIPVVGEIAIAVLFFLALVLGVVLTMLLLFGVVSLGLQTPTIGAEGRDAFDAIARGVGYVFARPWKYLLYTLLSLGYLCFSFVLVRMLGYLVLKVPYAFLKMWPWIGRAAEDGTPGKLARVWAEPTLFDLFRMPEGSGGTEYFAAVVIGIYVVVLLGLMVSFMPSFIMTSQTIIYFLMRRHVDFKDLDEVYTEAQEERGGLARLEKTEDTVVEPEPDAEDSDADEADSTGPDEEEEEEETGDT